MSSDWILGEKTLFGCLFIVHKNALKLIVRACVDEICGSLVVRASFWGDAQQSMQTGVVNRS